MVTAITTCAYSGAQFTLAGESFEAGQRTLVEVMPTPDPLVGAPLSSREATTDERGRLMVMLDVPVTTGLRPVARSVRVRISPDRSSAPPTLLAATPLNTAARSVSVQPAGSSGRAGGRERWRVVGIPEGTRLWAHYRRGGRTVERVALGAASEPCGRLGFELPTIPALRVRPGAWDLWITTRRRFAATRRRIHVQRPMRVEGRGRDAHVRFAALRSRLVSADPRITVPDTNFFKADATRLGVVRMVFGPRETGPVTFYERIGDGLRLLGTVQAERGVQIVMPEATTWSCSRLTRYFVATVPLPDGSFGGGSAKVRTSSCASRFRLSLPRRVVGGRRFTVRVIDRWGIGAITPTLCLAPPGGRSVCRRLRFAPAVTIARRSYRLRRRGSWRLELRIDGVRIRRRVRVGATAQAELRLPPLLVTGDSTIVGIDTFIADELASAARVRSYVRAGTGISKPPTRWPQRAAHQASSIRPAGTIVSLGGSDDLAMTTPAGGEVACCGEPWVGEYAERVRAMMRSYRRGGRGHVFWLTLPLARTPSRADAVRAVNAAIIRAAQDARGVTVVRLDEVFTPRGYREAMRWRGRSVRVRDPDGVHLSIEGQAIAARLIAPLVRRRLASSARRAPAR